MEDLLQDGRRRTAMDEVLRELRHPSPRGFLAPQIARMLLSTSRTTNLQAAEPLTGQQRASALLADLMTECSACHTVWCSPHALVPSGQTIRSINPAGLQCQQCRYTLCKDCLSEYPPPGTGPVDMPRIPYGACPTHSELTTPVLPTGRHDVKPRDPEGIEGVIVARNGPILPTMEDALPFVTKFLPLIADDAPIVHIRRSFPGAMDSESTRNQLAMSHIRELERDGVLLPGAWERSERMFVLSGIKPGTDCLITVVSKPG
ncbi:MULTISPECIES: hypothetical protein [Kitasatospora]|uniref:hypothetical protein n=1 Tax=Kitasatospora TaxID=2063 RepID=UPI000C6FCD72|nr:hypothetical protein [Kitasatospora sp. GP30]MDH6142979.1 hypothetical protein [Kitasatospora sp. GP30]